MGSVCTLTPDFVSQDSIKTLEALLGEARAGRKIGVAIVALEPGLRYSIYIAGECKRFPNLTRAGGLALDDYLSEMIRPHPAA